MAKVFLTSGNNAVAVSSADKPVTFKGYIIKLDNPHEYDGVKNTLIAQGHEVFERAYVPGAKLPKWAQ